MWSQITFKNLFIYINTLRGINQNNRHVCVSVLGVQVALPLLYSVLHWCCFAQWSFQFALMIQGRPLRNSVIGREIPTRRNHFRKSQEVLLAELHNFCSSGSPLSNHPWARLMGRAKEREKLCFHNCLFWAEMPALTSCWLAVTEQMMLLLRLQGFLGFFCRTMTLFKQREKQNNRKRFVLGPGEGKMSWSLEQLKMQTCRFHLHKSLCSLGTTWGLCIVCAVQVLCLPDAHRLFPVWDHSIQTGVALAHPPQFSSLYITPWSCFCICCETCSCICWQPPLSSDIMWTKFGVTCSLLLLPLCFILGKPTFVAMSQLEIMTCSNHSLHACGNHGLIVISILAC